MKLSSLLPQEKWRVMSQKVVRCRYWWHPHIVGTFRFRWTAILALHFYASFNDWDYWLEPITVPREGVANAPVKAIY